MGLKQIYRNYIDRIRRKPQRIRIFKQKLWEQYEIRTVEKQAVKAGRLTPEEIKETREYWKELGIKKVPLAWHQKYKAYSGAFDKRFVPEIYYTTLLEPSSNCDYLIDVLGDKNYINSLFAGVLCKQDWIRAPHAGGGGGSNGFFFGKDGAPVSKDGLIASLKAAKAELIIKPTVGESSGTGVRVLDLENGVDRRTGESIEQIVAQYGKNFVIQERLQEHADWARPNPSSINTVRLISYRLHDCIKVSEAVMRIGRGGSHLDNAHAGGMYIAVHRDGSLGKHAHVYGFGNRFEVHPDTNLRFEGYRIPYMDKIREAAVLLHNCLPNIGYVSWDFMVDTEGRVVLIEANLRCGSVWIIQNAHGTGAFGDDVKELFELAKQK